MNTTIEIVYMHRTIIVDYEYDAYTIALCINSRVESINDVVDESIVVDCIDFVKTHAMIPRELHDTSRFALNITFKESTIRAERFVYAHADYTTHNASTSCEFTYKTLNA